MIIERLVRFANTYSWYDHRMLSRELGQWKGRILDIGCGSRRLRGLLGSDTEYVGIDLYGQNADAKVDIARERYPFPNGSFDFAICNAVLEHVVDPVFVLREMHRVLKQGGKAYVSVPFLQPYHADPEDYRRLTAVGLTQLLEQQGFSCMHLPGAGGTFLAIEYLAFFELIQFLKQPRRFFNPARWLELAFLLPMYAMVKVANLFSGLFLSDDYASPGVAVVAQKQP